MPDERDQDRSPRPKRETLRWPGGTGFTDEDDIRQAGRDLERDDDFADGEITERSPRPDAGARGTTAGEPSDERSR